MYRVRLNNCISTVLLTDIAPKQKGTFNDSKGASALPFILPKLLYDMKTSTLFTVFLTMALTMLVTGFAVQSQKPLPIKLLSAEGSGWLMPGEVFEFYSEDGSRMIIETEDISYDEIDEDKIYLEITGKGFALHVSANL
jgi:hypothetical protein